MRSLIRFEDTYGLCDIYCASRYINYIDIKETGHITKVSDTEFIQSGLGICNCFKLSTSDLMTIKSLNIDNIIFVFDTDSMSGNKSKVMSTEEMSNNIRYVKKSLRGLNISYQFITVAYAAETIMLYQNLSDNWLNISYQFITVAYAAETIMLYQNLSDNWLHLNFEDYVHRINTDALHLVMLAASNKLDDIKKAKRVRNFINWEVLRNKLSKHSQLCRDDNYMCIQWLLDNIQSLCSEKQIIKLVNDIGIKFSTEMPVDKQLIIRDEVVSTKNRVFDTCKQFDIVYRP